MTFLPPHNNVTPFTFFPVVALIGSVIKYSDALSLTSRKVYYLAQSKIYSFLENQTDIYWTHDYYSKKRNEFVEKFRLIETRSIVSSLVDGTFFLGCVIVLGKK